MPKKERKNDMNIKAIAIPKATYSNGLQKTCQDGVVFTMPTSRKKSMSVDIRPDIDTLVFSREFMTYNLMDEDKVFPNIKKICIENGVMGIKIKNSTFPNVERVVSESSSFASGEMLIETGLYGQYTLINTFIKKPADVLNLADITFIADHALDGCLARIKKIDENVSVVSDAFKQYFEWNQPYVDGVKMVDSLIIDINSTAEVITMPDSLKRIEQHAFNGCKCLMHVDIGKGLTNLGEPFNSGAMFNGCRSLQHIDIPENIKYISSSCFSNSGLTSVTLHEGLETIDSGAFNCPIQNVEIPESVKNIDLWNFPVLNEANIKTHSIPVIASIVKSNCKKWSSRSSLTDLKINIDGMAYPIFVPAKLTEAGLRKLKSLLDTVLFRDTDSDDVNRTTFLSITSDPRIKQRLALKMYDAVECNEIKTYLRQAGKSIAEWMILDKDEDALIQFLKKDIITANTIDKLMPQMDAADMVNAKAYALEYIRKNTKEKSFRI